MCSVVGGPGSGKRYRGGDTQWAEGGKNQPLKNLHTATFDQNHIHSINRQPPGVAGVSKDSMLAEEV